MNETLLLSTKEISQRIDLPEIVDIVERVFAAHGVDDAVMPAKITLDLARSGEPNWCNAMPAFLPGMEAAGIKWAGGFLHNPERREMGYVQAMIILNDPVSGAPLAVLDGVWITNARTGAVPAVAAKHLANPGPLRVAIVGAGMQARWSSRALMRSAEVASITVCDKRPEAADAFVAEMSQELATEVRSAATVEAAVRGANLIITVTTADAPLVKREWVEPGALVVSMGSYQELDERLVLDADLRVVDHRLQNLKRGEFTKLIAAGRLSEDDIGTEFGSIVAGVAEGRTSPDQIIVASMIGMASTDMAIAQAAYQRAKDEQHLCRFRFQ